jgi:hypothetical protein
VSNRRKLRAKPKSKRGTVTTEEHESLTRVRGALSQLVRQGLADKSDWAPGEHGARQRTWRTSERGRRHTEVGVLVDARKARTGAGFLRVPLPRDWQRADVFIHERALVHITDPVTGATGLARVARIDERRHQMYLDPEWGAEASAPRTQGDARAEARPYECRSCGAQPGQDCATRNGTRAAWPHAGRDPLLSS